MQQQLQQYAQQMKDAQQQIQQLSQENKNLQNKLETNNAENLNLMLNELILRIKLDRIKLIIMKILLI